MQSGRAAATCFPGEGGTTPTASSDQQLRRTAVVWAIERTNRLRLYAYDATSLTSELLIDSHYTLGLRAGPSNNSGGGAIIAPMVANHKVCLGSDGQLTVFSSVRG